MTLELGGRVNDSFVFVLALLFGGFCMLSGPSSYWDLEWFKQESAQTEIIVSTGLTLIGVVFLWVAAVNGCRLFSASPDAVIDASGVALKPCMAPRPIAWHEITGSRVKREVVRGTVFTTLELDLAMPLRTLVSGFLPSRKIRLVSRIDDPVQEAGRIVRHYRRMAGNRP
jgi:hypothetical protein